MELVSAGAIDWATIVNSALWQTKCASLVATLAADCVRLAKHPPRELHYLFAAQHGTSTLFKPQRDLRHTGPHV